jgi:hypothetical protein
MNISGLNVAMGILIFVLVYAVVVLYIDLISLQKTNNYLNCKIIQLKSRLNDDLENGYCRDACERIGYEITPGLAKMFYELAKSYWEHESNINKS